MFKSKTFSPTVVLLGFVSLLTDISSEMLYPIMPFYLQSIGFTALWIGILEGVAEAVVGLSKGYFGKLSDDLDSRVPFVRVGYFLSSLSKPLLILFVYPVWVLFCRVLDRLGKGVRTGARDAILAVESTKETRGKVFGFHRAMDTLGAAIGPIVALIYLYYNPGEYKILFLIAFSPAILSVLFTFVLKEKPRQQAQKQRTTFLSSLKFWRAAPKQYRKIVTGFLLFALFNSSDAFLLLMGKSRGFSDHQLLLGYIFYNLVYASLALPGGALADRIGMKKAYLLGLIMFAVAYFSMSRVDTIEFVFFSFFIYALYASLTEGISRAWISNTVGPENAGAGIGLFSGFSSIMSLVASSLAGLIWVGISPSSVFVFAAAGATLTVIYFALIVKSGSVVQN